VGSEVWHLRSCSRYRGQPPLTVWAWIPAWRVSKHLALERKPRRCAIHTVMCQTLIRPSPPVLRIKPRSSSSSATIPVKPGISTRAQLIEYIGLPCASSMTHASSHLLSTPAPGSTFPLMLTRPAKGLGDTIGGGRGRRRKMRIVRSSEAEARRVPSGEKVMDQTVDRWAESV
jgi:hypothetical protein